MPVPVLVPVPVLPVPVPVPVPVLPVPVPVLVHVLVPVPVLPVPVPVLPVPVPSLIESEHNTNFFKIELVDWVHIKFLHIWIDTCYSKKRILRVSSPMVRYSPKVLLGWGGVGEMRPWDVQNGVVFKIAKYSWRSQTPWRYCNQQERKGLTTLASNLPR